MEELYLKYENFKEKKLSKRRFKHKDILILLQDLPFKKEQIGVSYEDRPIIKIVVGRGPRKILLWSQMHGNEATATMAIFDILNFLGAQNDQFESDRNEILDNLELHFIPMLNPDGAEQFIRRTALGIDMNRDAVALVCPESQILKNQVFKLSPEFSFNLHDQNIRYSAGISQHQATISFLATAYNQKTEWNESRIKARQVISKMNETLQEFIPDKIGRFSDEFEPRAFGDNIQKWGSSLILVESGGFPQDTEKQYIRKLNFVSILSGLLSISQNTYQSYTLADYENIPQNQKHLFDIKVENARIKTKNGNIVVDLGINLEEKNNANASDFEISSVIEDIGDLSVFWGIQTIDAKLGFLKPIYDFPEITTKFKQDKDFPKSIIEGSEASFIIDYGNEQTIILNGKIID